MALPLLKNVFKNSNGFKFEAVEPWYNFTSYADFT